MVPLFDDKPNFTWFALVFALLHPVFAFQFTDASNFIEILLFCFCLKKWLSAVKPNDNDNYFCTLRRRHNLTKWRKNHFSKMMICNKINDRCIEMKTINFSLNRRNNCNEWNRYHSIFRKTKISIHQDHLHLRTTLNIESRSSISFEWIKWWKNCHKSFISVYILE